VDGERRVGRSAPGAMPEAAPPLITDVSNLHDVVLKANHANG
jgi:hypothetical protein